MNRKTEESKGKITGEDATAANSRGEDDHTRLRAEKFRAATAARVKPSTETPDELLDYVEIISMNVDAAVFEPYFNSQSGPFERSLYENMSDLKSIRKVDDLLRTKKVIAVVMCIASAGMCVSSFLQSSPVRAMGYGIISADLLRISYNCYIKNYCALALKRLGSDGNPIKIGAAVFQWAQSAMGVANAEDPFMKLKKEIIWEVVTDKTISLQLYLKAKALMQQNSQQNT